MKLDVLCGNLIADKLTSDPEITGITTDPSLCRAGFLYVADECETVDSTRYGVRLDGRHYIDQAVANGAVVVLTTTDVQQPPDTIVLKHREPLALLGPLCARFYGEHKPQVVALVTGTNGKTSTVNFCRQLWSAGGLPACSVGNLGGVCSDGSVVWERDPVLSVPETVTLHKMLHDLAGRGFNHVAMEATSHALYDHRLTGVPATVAAFTNLTRDHLDFHGTMDEYFRVKMTLFDEVLPASGTAVINADTPWSQQAFQIARSKGHTLLSFGTQGKEIRLIDSARCATGQLLTLEIMGTKYQTELNLFGYFQVCNVLCSLAIVIGSGTSPDKAVEKVASLTEVEGRLNIVAVTPQGGRVVVDYAHSPDAIKAALEGCRTFTSGRLMIVFGCNGERDAGKRSQMGEMAASLADDVVVTDGHPRREDPCVIRREVMEGAPQAKEIGNRAAAIEYAIRSLGPEDTVLIAGFGHESFQTIGTERIPYSDAQTARRIVASLPGRMLDAIP